MVVMGKCKEVENLHTAACLTQPAGVMYVRRAGGGLAAKPSFNFESS